MSVGRTSDNSNTFWQFPRVGATQVLLCFRISHDVYFVILKKNTPRKYSILQAFKKAISIKQKIKRETLALAFLYESYELWHRMRRKSYTIIYLFTKYVIPKAKSFTCIGKYLIFNETYCSTYPSMKCENLVLSEIYRFYK